jgi:hypothetical protein
VLIKQENWISVCAHEDKRDLHHIFGTIRKYGYVDLTSISWYLKPPIMMKFQSTPYGMDKFHAKNIDWNILFSEELDWIILFANPLDFWLVAGNPDFVEEILGCSPDEAFSYLESIVSESTFFTDAGREHFSYLINQLQFVYPAAQPGEAIDFEFT